MGAIPRDYDRQCKFDSFCKSVLRNEARNIQRSIRRQRRRVTPLESIPQDQWDKLSTIDNYPSNGFVFSSHGYNMWIDNELVAAAFAELSSVEQSILILHCALDMTDTRIGEHMEMSRSAVQRHRTKALADLRTKLAAIVPKGG